MLVYGKALTDLFAWNEEDCGHLKIWSCRAWVSFVHVIFTAWSVEALLKHLTKIQLQPVSKFGWKQPHLLSQICAWPSVWCMIST